MSAPRVVAVIVHWSRAEDTLGCVAALGHEPGVGIVVVDNGAHEPIGPRLAAPAPGVTCVRNAENLGYAGGANTGIRVALEQGADVVLLLNDDARVQPGATAAALAVLDDDPRVAAVGAKVVTREDPGRLWLAWGRITWRQSLVGLVGADAPDGPAFADERDVEWIAGCSIWFRAAALGAIGLFDEEFFAYHEEVDWCARAREAGWRVVYAPSAVVTHTGRGTAGSRASIRIRKYFGARNSILFARKHGTTAQRALLWTCLVVTLPLQLLWHLPRGTAGDVWLKVRGIRDALAGRRPPFEALGLK